MNLFSSRRTHQIQFYIFISFTIYLKVLLTFIILTLQFQSSGMIESTIYQPSKDQTKIDTHQSEFQTNYYYGKNVFTRRILFIHTLLYLFQVKATLGKIDEDSNKNLSLECPDLPNIRFEDSAIHLANSISKLLEEKLKTKQQLDYKDIYSVFYQTQKGPLFQAFIFFLFETISRLLLSLMIFYLFGYVKDGNLVSAYIFAAICLAILIFGNISRHNGYEDAAVISARIRAGVIFIIFQKLSSLSQYTLKSTEIGKIINLLSNDFNSIENKMPILFAGMTVPFGVIGVMILLVVRVGWSGLLCIIIPITLLPLQTLVGKLNGLIQQRINIHKDTRVKITSQVIEGIKFIKLYGWELAFKKVIQDCRQQEVSNLMLGTFTRGFQRTLGNSSAVLGAFSSFVAIYYINSSILTTTKIISILELMVFFRLLLFFMGVCISFMFEINVTFQRVANIMNTKNIQMIKVSQFTKIPFSTKKDQSNKIQTINTHESFDVKVQVDSNIPDLCDEYPVSNGEIRLINMNGYWNHKNLEEPGLKNLNLFFEAGKLYGIGGKIGSGKSALLGVLLGQIPYYSGSLQVKGSISYVEQEPVIFSNTIKENILFGRQMNEVRYEKALINSCLKDDLRILENGEMTVVGERGMTLSGGQKARLCLARALYADADIYLLDDPLSAVDSKVAKIIFQTAIKQGLANKTVILVTHQIHYLELCDKLVIMQDGQVKKFDSPSRLHQDILELMASIKNKQEEEVVQQEQIDQDEEDQIKQNTNLNTTLQLLNIDQKQKEQIRQRRKSSADIKSFSEQSLKIAALKKQTKAQVNLKTYVKYAFFNKINYILFPLTILCFFLAEGFNVVFFRFISGYDKQIIEQTKTFKNIGEFWMFLGLIEVGFLVFMFLKYTLLYITNLKSNEAMHESMVVGVVRSPSSYFDVTPSGQLISKFSNDIGIMDTVLTFSLTDSVEGPIVFIVLLVNIFQINIFFIIVGVIAIVGLLSMFFFVKRAIIECKQLDLRSKSPMFNQLSETINGIVPIRIYNRKIYFLKDFAQKVNNCTKSSLAFFQLSRAFGVYLSFFSITILGIGFLIGVYNSRPDTAGLYAVSVIFLIQINDYLQWFLRQIINLESLMVSVERAIEITNLKSEGQLQTQYDSQIGIQDQQMVQLQQKWPKKPSFKVRNLTMKYREQLPYVLKGLDFDIDSYQKVGIIGRTGAGKSSIVQALLRISQPGISSVYEIDGCNVLKMGLGSLRQSISVIPQTPFLFKGSIKFNLDPFSKKSDEQLWNVLSQSGLKQYVESLPNNLNTDISNTSEIFSVGQKQLLCLARALTRRNKILFLDEATSNVDMRTDELIQNVLKSKFNRTTIIAIAHRLNTVADYDKLIVLNKGRVKQSGSPHQLLQKKGLFFQMVKNTGKNAEEITRIAKQAYQSKEKAIFKLKKRTTL